MINGMFIEIISGILKNFSLVLFLIVGLYKLIKRFEKYLSAFRDASLRLEVFHTTLVNMEKEFEAHRKATLDILKRLPKREDD